MSTQIAERPGVLTQAQRIHSGRQPNVSPVERLLSATLGVPLLATALVRRDRWALIAGLVGGGLLYRSATGRCSVYQALGKTDLGKATVPAHQKALRGVRVDTTVVVEQPPSAVYEFWRQLSNLPGIIDHLESVTEAGDSTHWIAVSPLVGRIEWDAEFIEDRPGELIAWRSLPSSQLATAGSLRITELPHGRGTAARLVMNYYPPCGKLVVPLASWLGTDVKQELIEGLRRMKRILETGEVATTEGQVAGSCRRLATQGET